MPHKRVAVTGANGHIGVQLIETLLLRDGLEPVAIVRSDRAALALHQRFGERLRVSVVDYGNADALRTAFDDATVCVHLVGIIRQTAHSTYEDAHERPCQAIVKAGQSLQHVVYLSILGVGDLHLSNNVCLRSRARAEEILRNSSISSSVVRVPMVLGPDDYASYALAKKAMASVRFEFRPSSLEQPIDSIDVVAALVKLVVDEPRRMTVELAGSESITRRELVKRAAKAMGRVPGMMIGLPMWLGYSIAKVLAFLPSPPVTRDMLEILNHDDAIDASSGAETIGISLTPLDETLERVLRR